MNTWWYVGGLGGLGWVLLLLGTHITVGRAQAWWAWAVGAAGVLSTLAAGAWLTKGTWVFRLAGWVIHLHPIIGVIVGLGVIFGTVWAILAVLPHTVSSRVAVSTSVALLAFFLPTLAVQAAPPGKVGHAITNGIFQVTGQTEKVTAGWFG